MRIDMRAVDARIDEYCAKHPQASLEDALTSLVRELDGMR
jgi:hypothetical protein